MISGLREFVAAAKVVGIYKNKINDFSEAHGLFGR